MLCSRLPMLPKPRNLRLVFLVLLCATACSRKVDPPPKHLVERSVSSMGSELRLSVWTPDEPGANAAFTAISMEFDRLEGLMSTWKEGSDIQKLNAAAGKHAVPVDPEIR